MVRQLRKSQDEQCNIKDVITETGIDVAFLPPNMTGELQVLDLVVNGPIKAHVKNKRATRLDESFQLFKKERLTDMELPREQRKNHDFSPPKPTMLKGMKDLILLFQEQFTEEKFQHCINIHLSRQVLYLRSQETTQSHPVLSEFMDSPHPLLNENNRYGRGFKFACRLREDTNHTCGGYLIDVIIFSVNSDSWTNLFCNVLAEKNIFCHN
jgi:hypothetical protein